MENKEQKYGGIVDNLIDNILEKYGISEEMVKKITSLTDEIMKHVSVQQIGQETFITIHLNKINFRLKR